MPKYEVIQGSSMLDLVLEPTRASTGHIEINGRRTMVTVIELSKQEIEDWERVSEEYHAWAHRIQEMSIAARKAASR